MDVPLSGSNGVETFEGEGEKLDCGTPAQNQSNYFEGSQKVFRVVCESVSVLLLKNIVSSNVNL